MKYKSLLFCLVIGLMLGYGLCEMARAEIQPKNNSSNAKIHLITAGDYRGFEGNIRNGIEKDVTSIRQFFQKYVSESQLELYEIDGRMVTPNKISETISSLNVKQEDTVVFYYSGHAANATEGGGHYFQLKDEKGESVTLQRIKVRNELVKTGAHLVVLLTDCCNIQLPKDVTGGQDTKDFVLNNSIIEQLFIKPSGILDLTSCKIDQVSLATDNGSIATQAWILIFDEVNKELINDSSKKITWDDIVPRMNQRQNELFKKKYPNGYKLLDNNGNCTLQQDTQDIQVFEYPDQPRFGARVQTTTGGYVVVTEVVPDSPAQKGGLQIDDIIDKINDMLILTEEEYDKAIDSSPEKMTAIVKRIKNNNTETLTLNFTLIGPPKEKPVTPDNNSTNGNTADKPQFGITVKNGTEIASVIADSVADYYGLKVGDLISKIDGKDVGNSEDIANALKQTGNQFQLTYTPNGKNDPKTITIDYTKCDNAQSNGGGDEEDKPRGKYKFGAGVKGNVIADVKEGTPAAKEGLVKGDKILEINGKKIKSSTDFIKAIDEAEAGEKARFVVCKAKTNDEITLLIPLCITDGKDSESGSNSEKEGVVFGAGLKGNVIDHVIKDTPAAKAGLKKGDVITVFNGIKITSGKVLQDAIDNSPAETTLTILDSETQEEQDVTVTLNK